MEAPGISVVVPTRGRAAYLEVTLDSLRRQRTRIPYELLVVDDGAGDATPDVAGRFEARVLRSEGSGD
jgi:glycosyltransferase involved in cell wall biosynthesis